MSDSIPHPRDTAPYLGGDVEARLLYTAYARKPLNLLITASAALLIGGLLGRFFPAPEMTLWTAALLVDVAIGCLEYSAFQRAAPQPPAIARWRKIFLAGALVAGAAWALGPCLLIGQARGAELTLLVTLLLAVCTVAMISLAEQRTAMLSFVAAVAAPPALVLCYSGAAWEGLVALALVCGTLLMMLVGYRLNQTMRELLENQGRTRAILDTALDAIIEIDAQGRITDWSRRAETIFGWRKSEALGRPLDETILAPAQRDAFRGSLVGAVPGQVLTQRIERVALRQDGSEFPVEMSLTPLQRGLLGHFTVFIADITERKLAQARIIDSEERFRTLIEWTREAIAVHRNGLLIYVNPAAIAMFGASSGQDLLGRPVLDFVHPDFLAIVQTRMKNTPVDQVVTPMVEQKFVKLDGTAMDVEIQATRISYAGAPAVQVAMRDVTEHKQNVVKLALTNKRLGALIEAIPDAIFFKDPESRWQITNEPAKRLFHLHGLAWQDKTEMELAQLHPEFRAAHEACLVDDEKAWQAGKLALFFETMVDEDGTAHEFEVRKMPVFDEQGQRQALVIIGRDVTERKKAEEALEENRQKYQALSEAASEAIFISEQGQCLEQNSRAQELFGYTSQEAVGRSDTEWIAPRDRDRVLKNMLADYELPYEATGLRKDGSTFPVLLRGKRMHYKGKVVRVLTMDDITERKQAEEAQRIAATAFDSQQGMMVTDAQRQILRVNKAFSAITGYEALEAVGQTPQLLASGRHDADFFAAMWGAIARSGSWQGEIWNRRKNGELFPAWFTISAVTDETGQTSHYVGAFADLSSRKTAEDQIRNLAFYDTLTGLPNRRLLIDRLEQALLGGGRPLRKGALLFVDIDNFKTLNDTLGHSQGDLLLQQVARRLSNCTREGDTVARLSGDEFVVLLENLSRSDREAARQAETVGEKILLALHQPYQLDNGEHHSTSSIGITLLSSQQQGSTDEPLKRAELAMYQAKAAGRNALRFFDPQMQAEVTTRATLEADLREAILKDQFVLYYQPQVVGKDRLTGVEALLRWQHPERGLVLPAEFIPLAEDSDLILALGQWVLETACAQLKRWAGQPALAQLSIAVNVSARQFHREDFVTQVLTVLERSGANPKLLKLELTESLLVDDVEGVIAKMSALKTRGVGFSLDDFGTGYSSLSYLKRLPLDQLKIDQGFVRNILTDPNDAAIAKMVIALADSMGLAVLAEGVEIEAQRDFLAHQGCHAYQGYLFSRPLPVDEFEAFARR
ncbi:MAG: PAS domain S-box protein [Rhodoferax sp.]|uniref:PAS domain S-box protein n=1 Tax=Rhodoferax sp. TaxID=50421 RepID=UPI0026117805|nr:PAS domain S-box protein [Rhodoferax sp.]MDD5334600.1 PAS domain S-box protein [Rhodoferax sp.]